MGTDVESVVVGGGVVGLAVARALCLARHDTVLLEQHGRLGTEISSRNSGVIHAGLYYPPGSLKARLCVEGKKLLYHFAEENGVPHSRCGKLLVATTPDEIARLAAIAETAARNGDRDLVPLTAIEATRLEPELRCAAAFLSPSTGVIDCHHMMLALEGHITTNGGNIVLNARVTRMKNRGDGFDVTSESADGATTISARNIVIAGGLGATHLGSMLEYEKRYRVPETFPAKGHYYALSTRSPFRRLVYPMPDGAWLGIHLTLDLAGRAKFGPDLQWTKQADYAFEDEDGARRKRFETAIRRYWPGLPEGALAPDYTGIRPKIYREGEPAADFAIHGAPEHGIPRLVALYGIESPGLTASLAIANYVAALLR